MSTASSALQRAVFAALAGDAELLSLTGPDAISDHPRTGAFSPHILISAIDSTDWSSFTELGEEHLLTLEIRADGEGHRDVEAMAARVGAVLHHGDLMLPGAHLVDLAWQSTRIWRDSRGHIAEMRFRGLTE